MRAVRHFLLPIAAAAVVAACGGEGSSNTPPSSSGPRAGNPSMQPQRTLQMPVPERSSSLRGMDADGNGVRDDIDAFIHSSVTDPARKDAVLQLARSKQEVMALVESGQLGDPNAVKAVKIKGAHAVNCFFDRFDFQAKESWQISNAIQKMAYDTLERARAYLDYNEALNGRSWPLPSGDTCE